MFGIDKQITEQVDKHTSKFSKVLKNCLKAKNENILIISDYGNGENKLAAMVGYGYYSAAMEKGYKSRIIFQDVKKGFMHADDSVIQALRQVDENTIVILSLSNKLGRLGELGKSFRTYCRDRNARFISASGLGGITNARFDTFLEAMNVNYNRMRKHGDKIKKKLDKAKEIRVKTEKGTDVTFDISGTEAISNVGDYKELGSGGNIPAGEVYIAPTGLEGVNGTIVIDGSMRSDDGTQMMDEPLRLEVEKGRIVRIEGKYKAVLENTLIKREDRAKYPERVRLIGELGIGINPCSLLVGNSLLDEKVLGTAHIAIGSNYWFGGAIRTILHLDQVFLSPKFYLDGKEFKI